MDLCFLKMGKRRLADGIYIESDVEASFMIKDVSPIEDEGRFYQLYIMMLVLA